MTKRAKHIRGFVDALANLAINGMHYKLTAFDSTGSVTPEDKSKSLKSYKQQLQVMEAHMCEIMENNPEQAEALMAELGLKWNKPKV